jgi:3-oxoacyl-[acyl-carrier protein] reductase
MQWYVTLPWKGKYMAVEIELSGKVALITGSTRGIGKSIAEKFVSAGATVIITGTHKNSKDSLTQGHFRIKESNTEYICADFSDKASLEVFIQKIRKYPKIDICVNNAGTNKNNLIGQTRIDDYNFIMDINLHAPFRISRALCGSMAENGYGRIVNIASIWSVVSKPGRSIYAMTKAGLTGLTRTMAVELASKNVLVNSVSPGFTMTELTRETLTKDDMEELKRIIPAGRFADPDEVATLVLFLCSDLNTYITGQNIVIDGGFTNV